MSVLTILPPREGYTANNAGAISLLVSRLAQQEDLILGTPVDGAPLPGGHFVAAPEPSSLWRWCSDNYRYLLSCREVIRQTRPDLIEVHNKPALAAALAGSVPVNLVLHNDPQEMRGARAPRQRQALMERVTIITVSDWLRRRYLEDLDRAPVTVMPNCLDLAALPERASQRAPVILFVGRVVANKGVDAFVRAWGNISRHVPGWHAVIIGADRFQVNGPRTVFLDRIERQADTLGVEHLGFQPHSRVLDAMSRAAIVVVPSRWPEPFGLTALEAMASGAAVIASPNGGLPEVVGDAALFAQPDAEGELETALLKLIGNDGLRTDLAAKGLRRARDFDVSIARARLQAIREAAMARVKKAR